MRVVTWNMGCGSPRSTGRFQDVHDEAWRLLLAFEPDVVLAQEALLDVPSFVRDAGTVVAQQPSYQGQEAGTALLVRGDVTATGEHVRIPGSHLAAAEIAHEGQTMFLASVHVDTNDQQANLRSLVEALRPLVDGRRFVVGGDFNAARQCDVVANENLYGQCRSVSSGRAC
jgi:endonuclease/exonuclease/phosphatase (EEP) superfamily protein YafD